jgi:Sensors of blue-light using FAD
MFHTSTDDHALAAFTCPDTPQARSTAVVLEPAKQLWQLVYASAASADFTVADLQSVLRAARERNPRIGVTGMLLFEGTSFLQILEGEVDALDALYERISADPRHARQVLLLREQIDTRSFGKWTMGYTRLAAGDLEDTLAVHDFHANADTFSGLSDDKVRKLLKLFRTGSFRRRLDQK